MRNLFLAAFALSCLFMLTGCDWRGAKAAYAAKVLRTDKEVADAALRPDGISPQVALKTISDNAGKAADKIDPDQQSAPVTTADKIVTAEKTKPSGQPNPELQKIYQFVDAGPGNGFFGWGTILGFGAMALGVAGQFLGPPFNLIGSVVQRVAAKTLPSYDRDRKAAASVVISVDQMLTDYGSLLDAQPETKAALTAKLGMDPVTWMKQKLETTSQDLGTHEEVADLISTLKQQMTTQSGVLKPSADELDAWVSKKI